MERNVIRAACALLRDYFMPPRCPSCKELLPIGREDDSPFCRECGLSWERELLEACPGCGLALPDCVCVPELLRKVGVRDTIFLAAYRAERPGVPNRLVYYIKENRDLRVLASLGRTLAIRVGRLVREAELPTDRIVVAYLPRRSSAVRRYGFDQAREHARAIAKETGYPVLHAIKRRSAAQEQKRLSREERRKNLENAFRLSGEGDLTGRTVLLVDDVVTTGSGLAACAELLLGAGAETVIPVTVARTEERREKRVRTGIPAPYGRR